MLLQEKKVRKVRRKKKSKKEKVVMDLQFNQREMDLLLIQNQQVKHKYIFVLFFSEKTKSKTNQ